MEEEQLALLNDDRVGRALDRLFASDVPSLVLAVATHGVREFAVRLEELHNDSTTNVFASTNTEEPAGISAKIMGIPPCRVHEH